MGLRPSLPQLLRSYSSMLLRSMAAWLLPPRLSPTSYYRHSSSIRLETRSTDLPATGPCPHPHHSRSPLPLRALSTPQSLLVPPNTYHLQLRPKSSPKFTKYFTLDKPPEGLEIHRHVHSEPGPDSPYCWQSSATQSSSQRSHQSL